MTDRIKEQLSTFLDGELPEPESALLLKRLERDDDLRGALSRYSLIGAVLRSDGDVPAARQVAARVSAAIAREPVRAAALLRMPGREVLVRSLGGLAIAAGVAFGSVLLVQQVGMQDPATPAAVMAEVVESPVVPVADEEETLAASYVTPPAADAPVGLPPAELANYLVAHYGYASPLVRRSVGAGLIGASQATAVVDVPPEQAQAGR
ncbi:MAG: sigma-E factor negative regulatory protein [Steroidobacteraceae bacterium]